ncbi:MAG: hypothetical protein WCK57_02885 [Verrucomicrobiae bacterium]
MNQNERRPLWLCKRFLLPLIFLLGVAVALAVAVSKSDTCKIIIYNETGKIISALKITACGQETALRDLTEEESFRWKLAKNGAPGEITLETAANPPWRWHGGYIKTHGGYRIILKLEPDGEVEVQSQISVWQRWFDTVFQQ